MTVYLLNGSEAVKTGRKATRTLPSGREETLYEFKPLLGGDWTVWADLSTMYEIVEDQFDDHRTGWLHDGVEVKLTGRRAILVCNSKQALYEIQPVGDQPGFRQWVSLNSLFRIHQSDEDGKSEDNR